MFKKDKSASDAFMLSLGGITTITSFAAASAIAPDQIDKNQMHESRLNKTRDKQVDQAQADLDRKPRLSFGSQRQAVQFCCA